MKLSLYNIELEYLTIRDQLIENGGELTPEIEASLVINEQNLTTKGTNYGFVIKDLEAEISVIDSEIERLKKLKESRNNAIERLENNIKTAMTIYGLEEIKSPVLKINFRNSESVEVVNIDLLDKEYTTTKTTISADKAKIKQAIKDGKTVIGAVIKQNKNLQIK